MGGRVAGAGSATCFACSTAWMFFLPGPSQNLLRPRSARLVLFSVIYPTQGDAHLVQSVLGHGPAPAILTTTL